MFPSFIKQANFDSEKLIIVDFIKTILHILGFFCSSAAMDDSNDSNDINDINDDYIGSDVNDDYNV